MKNATKTSSIVVRKFGVGQTDNTLISIKTQTTTLLSIMQSRISSGIELVDRSY